MCEAAIRGDYGLTVIQQVPFSLIIVAGELPLPLPGDEGPF